MNLLRDTSWDCLLAFAEFAEDANFTRAARRLHLSQPALHTRIANLARSVGAPLYIRRGRRIDITETGRKVQRFARELATSTAGFEAELLGECARQTITLTSGEGTYLYLLGPALRSFNATSKHTLRLQTADRDASLEAVLSAHAQLGVAPLEAVPPGVISQSLTRVGQVLAMPTKHPLAKRRTVHTEDLQGTRLVLPPVGRPHRTMVTQTLQSAGVEWHVAMEASGWELMLHFVQLGFGLAIVNACCRLPPGVTTRPLPEFPAIHYQVFHLDRKLPAAVLELKRSLSVHANHWKE